VTDYKPTERTRIRRRPERGSYDRDLVYRIIDEALLCHVAFVLDGEPRVLPTTVTRVDNDIYIHGSNKNGLLTALAQGALASIAITHTDGVVVGRSGFGCSLEYRSVVAYGTATLVAPEDKERIMNAVLQDIIPGFGGRRLKPSELATTQILKFPLDEVSAKVRNHGNSDADGDYELDLWAGVIPLTIVAGEPISDGKLKPGIPVPEYAQTYHP
jgi:nitroimidazol reductase NimA-like FMN-containing flavoprotein (pyridoxamine 5'-phosphate oxidase superfamily)